MRLLEPTPLEHALLRIFHELYGTAGFPLPERIRVRKREDTGGGRYVDLDAESALELQDGYLDLGGRFIEMDGIPHGLMAVVLVKGSRPVQMEIAVYGGHAWDGEERRWSIR